MTIKEAKNHSSSTSYELSNSELPAFTDSHVIHYETGNVQTEIFGFGTYKDIFQRMLRNEAHRENIVERIFELVQNKKIANTEKLSQELNNFAEQLTHLLFIVEMQRNNATLFTAPMFLELIIKDTKYLKEEIFFPLSIQTAISKSRGIVNNNCFELPNTHFMDYDINNIKEDFLLLRNEGHILVEWFSKFVNIKLEHINQLFNIITSVQATKIKINENINLINLKELQDFVKLVNSTNFSNGLVKSLEENLYNLIPHFGSRPEQYLLLFKEALLKKTIFSKKVKDLIENTFFEFQKILPKLDSFLVKVQADLKKDIKKIIPEILQILCAKIKEWYNIDAPEYITSVKTVEEFKNKEVLKDITAKINNSNSIFSQSGDKLKFSIPPIKRKIVSTENINNKLLKTHNEETYDSSLDDAIKEYYKIMGEDSSSISL
ncbi:hypothetical protein A1I_02695 [Rickettsia bellii OSU 85-389]|uniref:hypothetical protein n=1 Tax=Rickettsia bellii TaxID=33990 RepID=UPI0000DB0E7F|nr:hypothetical protein [Rickettsia bellii]ABV78910.1 hypothetical protein A1I_02695 [Rickettsia bellii OSU 85-389]